MSIYLLRILCKTVLRDGALFLWWLNKRAFFWNCNCTPEKNWNWSWSMSQTCKCRPVDHLNIVMIKRYRLRPSDIIWCHGPWSTLVQVMACCLTAPSHNLNYSADNKWALENKLQWSFMIKSKFFIEKDSYKCAVCKVCLCLLGPLY